MDSFVFALNAVMPIILMVAIGYVLKLTGFLNAEFCKLANKLVFRFFLPAMLFLNVYNMESVFTANFGYIFYSVAVIIIIFLISIPIVILISKDSGRRGALLQGVFRSNYALIGIPLAQSLFGDDGALIATLLSAVTIPLYNILAVISLSIFTNEGKFNVKKVIMGIVKNPLIQSILLGLLVLCIRPLLVNSGVEFRFSDIEPLFSVLKYLSNLATPLALLVLGGQFEFSVISSLKREIIFGTFMKIFVVPIIGIGIAYLFFNLNFGGAEFASFVALFATPVAVSSVPMAQEMKNDTVLAGQLVVWTTLFSGFTVFIFTFILSLLGVF